MAKTNSTHHLRKMRKNTIVAQDLEHELFKVWSGRVVSKQFIESKLNKGNKFYDVKFHEATFVNPKDGVAYFKTVADTPNVDLRTVKSTKVATKHHGGGVVINNINKRSSWWWLWIVVTILSIVIIILALLLGLKSCSNGTTSLQMQGEFSVEGSSGTPIQSLHITTKKVNSSGGGVVLTQDVIYDFDDTLLPNGLVADHLLPPVDGGSTPGEQADFMFSIHGTPVGPISTSIENDIPLTAHWKEYSVTENIHIKIHADDSFLTISGSSTIIGFKNNAMSGSVGGLKCKTNSGTDVNDAVFSILNTPLLLPNGITFNAPTGQFMGTPTEEWPETTYNISATSPTYPGIPCVTFNVTLSIKAEVPTELVITGAPTTITGTVNSDIVDTNALTTKTDTDIPITDAVYTVDPSTPLPDGLVLNESTGVISGKPTESFDDDIIIWVSSPTFPTLDGCVTIHLEIDNPAPTSLVINNAGNISESVGTSFTSPSLECKTNLGTLVTDASYAVVSVPSGTALPTGITFNSSTGVFSGTPSATFAQTTFRISVSSPTYSGITGYADITITINESSTTGGGPNKILIASDKFDQDTWQIYSMLDMTTVTEDLSISQAWQPITIHDLYNDTTSTIQDVTCNSSYDIISVQLSRNGMGWSAGGVLQALPDNFLYGADLGGHWWSGVLVPYFIPDTITSIGENFLAESWFSGMNMVIPDNPELDTIDTGFMYHCDYLDSVNVVVGENIKHIKNSFMHSCMDWDGDLIFKDISELLTIGQGFLGVDTAFNSKLDLFDSKVTTINSNFLNLCEAFDSELILPQYTTSIVDWDGGTDDNGEIDSGFMNGCYDFSGNLSLPDTVERISEGFMYACYKVQSVELSISINIIADTFMQGCNELKFVDFKNISAGSISNTTENFTGKPNMLNVGLSTVPAYVNGVKIEGTNAAAIKTRFPNYNGPYNFRNLI